MGDVCLSLDSMLDRCSTLRIPKAQASCGQHLSVLVVSFSTFCRSRAIG
jgi:hypothetical protein